MTARPEMGGRCRGLLAALTTSAVVVATGCTSDPVAGPERSTASPSVSAPSSDAGSQGRTPRNRPGAGPPPTSVLALAAQEHRGDRLRLGAVRERTAAFTSYDVTYRSRGNGPRGEEELTISGVLNVPTGPGPHPAVVLAHGYIDPAVYVSGQGMTRERGFLAERGYVVLHTDYRNHAGSDDDPRNDVDVRLGYVSDVINAVGALRRTRDVPVDDDRVALMGRSMGGGVVQKVAAVAPGLVDAVSPWAAVSSLEGENFDHFVRGDLPALELDAVARRFGLPEDEPAFWRRVSARPYLHRVTEPVLLVHGRRDEVCPPAWATATQRALRRAGVASQLAWYDDRHAFGPAFERAMERTVGFFDRHL